MSVLGRSLAAIAFLFAVLVGPLAGPAAAQIPDKFENLKVLPKDISKRDLVATMRAFSGALGVRCKHCHVPGKDPNSLDGYDFASDEPKHKNIARAMLKMVTEINENQIAKAGIESPSRVRCVTCHRGLEKPETLDNVMMAAVEKEGAAKAEEKYRMLRTDYYGSGSYDFRPQTLQQVAERIASDPKKVDSAISMLKLNLEFAPEDAQSHVMLGQMYGMKGDRAAAIASFERAVELEPDNAWVKQQLEKARSAK
jgi:tetratricopeptide (TPR) repeat protein